MVEEASTLDLLDIHTRINSVRFKLGWPSRSVSLTSSPIPAADFLLNAVHETPSPSPEHTRTIPPSSTFPPPFLACPTNPPTSVRRRPTSAPQSSSSHGAYRSNALPRIRPHHHRRPRLLRMSTSCESRAFGIGIRKGRGPSARAFLSIFRRSLSGS